MELCIDGQYIMRNSYEKKRIICLKHGIANNPYHLKIYAYVISYFKQIDVYPPFLKLYDQFIAQKQINACADIIQQCSSLCLMHIFMQWLSDANIDLVDYDKLYMIFLFSEKCHPTNIQKELIDTIHNMIDATDIIPCTCQCILFIEKSVIKGNRIDLLQKYLSANDICLCENVDLCIKNKINDINNNMQKIKYRIESISLNKVPKHLWSDIFERYCKNGPKNNYLFIDSNLENIYSGIFIENISYKWIHQSEYESGIDLIYELNANNESYCVLCDKFRPASLILIGPYFRMNCGLHICHSLCGHLALHFGKKNFVGDYTINFKSLRYVTNKLVILRTGYVDITSILSTINLDIMKHIAMFFIELVGI